MRTAVHVERGQKIGNVVNDVDPAI